MLTPFYVVAALFGLAIVCGVPYLCYRSAEEEEQKIKKKAKDKEEELENSQAKLAHVAD